MCKLSQMLVMSDFIVIDRRTTWYGKLQRVVYVELFDVATSSLRALLWYLAWN